MSDITRYYFHPDGMISNKWSCDTELSVYIKARDHTRAIEEFKNDVKRQYSQKLTYLNRWLEAREEIIALRSEIIKMQSRLKTGG